MFEFDDFDFDDENFLSNVKKTSTPSKSQIGIKRRSFEFGNENGLKKTRIGTNNYTSDDLLSAAVCKIASEQSKSGTLISDQLSGSVSHNTVKSTSPNCSKSVLNAIDIKTVDSVVESYTNTSQCRNLLTTKKIVPPNKATSNIEAASTKNFDWIQNFDLDDFQEWNAGQIPNPNRQNVLGQQNNKYELGPAESAAVYDENISPSLRTLPLQQKNLQNLPFECSYVSQNQQSLPLKPQISKIIKSIDTTSSNSSLIPLTPTSTLLQLNSPNINIYDRKTFSSTDLISCERLSQSLDNKFSARYSYSTDCRTPEQSGGIAQEKMVSKNKQRFPGPAGLLPNRIADKTLIDISVPRPNLPSVFTPKTETTLLSQNCEDDFTKPPWLQMLKDLKQLDKILKQINLDWVKRRASMKRLPNGKVPILCVLLKSITVNAYDGSAILKDPTGEIQGTVQGKLLEEYQMELQPGAVLVLSQVSVLSPSSRKHYLNVTLKNLINIYCPKEDSSSITIQVNDLQVNGSFSETNEIITSKVCFGKGQSVFPKDLQKLTPKNVHSVDQNNHRLEASNMIHVQSVNSDEMNNIQSLSLSTIKKNSLNFSKGVAMLGSVKSNRDTLNNTVNLQPLTFNLKVAHPQSSGFNHISHKNGDLIETISEATTVSNFKDKKHETSLQQDTFFWQDDNLDEMFQEIDESAFFEGS